MSTDDKNPMPASATGVGARPARRSILDRHKILETNATLLLIFSFLVVTIGGLVQIVPLFYLENTIEDVEGMRPYSPLELAGRDIYIREGCYVCHSQMIRPMRDEVERYGHYQPRRRVRCTTTPSSGAPSAPGRIWPGWAGAIRMTGTSSTCAIPQSVVPESVMPKYGFLETKLIEPTYIGGSDEDPSRGRRALYRRDDRERRGGFHRTGRSRQRL